MAAAATNSPTLSLFPGLPRELRDHIWRDALPDTVGPAFYFYRRGCWCPRRLSESDKVYDPANDESNLYFEFRHDLLDDVQFEMPLVFVNREARSIALAWIREHGIDLRPRKGRHYPVFVRRFDPARDTLYVALDRWDDFLREPDDRLSQPDLFGQLVDVKADLTRIAVPEALLRREVDTLPEMLRNFFRLRVLSIIVGAPPALQSADDDVKVRQRWEFRSARGAFFWDGDRGGFDFGDGEDIGDEALCRLIEEANRGLGEALAKEHIRSFEIRPVSCRSQDERGLLACVTV